MPLKKNNPGCSCCSCIVCTSDNFNRTADDVTVGAPIPWVPADVFDTSGTQLILDENSPLNGNEALLLEQDIKIGETTDYKVTLGMVDWNDFDTIGLMISWESDFNFYAATYTDQGDGSAVLAIYWVVGNGGWTAANTPDPDSWILLNSTVINSLSTYDPPYAIECEVSLTDGLMEIRTLSGGLPTSVDDACIAYYTFNFGTKVGICTGWMNGGDAHVDNFSLCENRCVVGCIIHVDNYNRANNVNVHSTEHSWDESEESAAGDIQILDGRVHWTAGSDPLWFGDPHPNGFTTMGVLVKGVIFHRSCSSGSCAVDIFDAKFIIYVAVDQVPSPTKYVKVTFDAFNDTVTISGVNNTGDPGIEEEINTGSSGLFGVNQLYDLYVCVSSSGRVSAYAWNSEVTGDGQLTPIATGMANEGTTSFLGGPYCGMRGEWQQNVFTGVTYTTWTSIDEFAFIRTYHPGDPKIIRWTVGGTVEVGDKFLVEITKDGITESYTVTTTETDLDLVAQEIVDTINGLDAYDYYTLRSVEWYKDEATTGAFIATTESDFDANPSTTENDNSEAVGQTFTVETVQEFVQGDSRCPRCPPPCGDCSLCEGASLPQHSAPSAVMITVGGVVHDDNHNPLDNLCWAVNQPGSLNPSDYSPPFPGVQDETETCEDGLGLCNAYNGSFILEGCECGYAYYTGDWYDFYYPDPDPDGGPPGTYTTQILDPDSHSCFPGVACDGFFITAQILDAGGGMRYWYVKYDDNAGVAMIWESEEFPANECKQPRSLTMREDLFPTAESYGCHWPTTIHLSPLD